MQLNQCGRFCTDEDSVCLSPGINSGQWQGVSAASGRTSNLQHCNYRIINRFRQRANHRFWNRDFPVVFLCVREMINTLKERLCGQRANQRFSKEIFLMSFVFDRPAVQERYKIWKKDFVVWLGNGQVTGTNKRTFSCHFSVWWCWENYLTVYLHLTTNMEVDICFQSSFSQWMNRRFGKGHFGWVGNEDRKDMDVHTTDLSWKKKFYCFNWQWKKLGNVYLSVKNRYHWIWLHCDIRQQVSHLH